MPSRRILVIEDEPKTRASIVLYLEHAGFEVRAASDGRTGLALARESRDRTLQHLARHFPGPMRGPQQRMQDAQVEPGTIRRYCEFIPAQLEVRLHVRRIATSPEILDDRVTQRPLRRRFRFPGTPVVQVLLEGRNSTERTLKPLLRLRERH